MNDKYDDIIDLPRFVSKNRRHMSDHDRAAQFAPFAALSGYEESINEAARIVDDQIELGEEEIQLLDYRFHLIDMNIADRPEVIITYFVPDRNKKGGSYHKKKICIRRIDMVERILVTVDKEKYSLDDICMVEGQMFEKML